MARLLVTDPELREAALALGHDLETDPRWIGEVDAVLLREDWDAVRGWRANAILAGVVIFSQAPPPRDRPRLEPVALLRHLADLESTLAQLFQGRPSDKLKLSTGVVHLDNAAFSPETGDRITLSSLECRLLGYLGSRSGRAISREELQLQVWDHRKHVPTRAVDMAVSRLRKKIEPNPQHPVALMTVRHGGYRLLILPSDAGVSQPLIDTIGRLEELDQAERLLGQGVLWITGPAGVGKTHLARAIALRLGRCVSIDLAGVTEPAFAAVALAAIAHQPVDPGETPKRVIERLYRKLAPATITWDHIDDLLAVEPLLAPRISGLQVVFTRREKAGPNRTELRLLPLTELHAANLLSLRARQAGTRVEPNTLLPLVNRLDRLPLALELAATRLAALGIQGLMVVLDEDAGLLDPGQNRLRRSIDRSLDRLASPALGALGSIAQLLSGITPEESRSLLGLGSARAWVELVDNGLLLRRGKRFVVLHAVRDALFARSTADPERIVRFLAGITDDAVRRLHGRHGLPSFERLVERLSDFESARDHAHLNRAIVAQLQGRDMGSFLRPIDPTALSSTGVDQYYMMTSINTDQSEINERASRSKGAYGDAFRELMHADPDALQIIMKPPSSLVIRILARLRATAKSS